MKAIIYNKQIIFLAQQVKFLPKTDECLILTGLEI